MVLAVTVGEFLDMMLSWNPGFKAHLSQCYVEIHGLVHQETLQDLGDDLKMNGNQQT